MQRLVDECLGGRRGAPRPPDRTVHCIAGKAGHVDCIMRRSRTWLHPRQARDAAKPARVRPGCKTDPMVGPLEQAGAAAGSITRGSRAWQSEHPQQRVALRRGAQVLRSIQCGACIRPGWALAALAAD